MFTLVVLVDTGIASVLAAGGSLRGFRVTNMPGVCKIPILVVGWRSVGTFNDSVTNCRGTFIRNGVLGVLGE